MSDDKTIDINDLALDESNDCKHGERNLSVIQSSLEQFGAFRSIAVDGDGVVRAGNGTVAGAKAAGITKVRIIKAKPDELVAVQRDDLKGEQAIAAGMADNRSSDLHEYDEQRFRDRVAQLATADIDLNLDAIALGDVDVDAMFGPLPDVQSEHVEAAAVDGDPRSGNISDGVDDAGSSVATSDAVRVDSATVDDRNVGENQGTPAGDSGEPTSAASKPANPNESLSPERATKSILTAREKRAGIAAAKLENALWSNRYYGEEHREAIQDLLALELLGVKV